MKLTIFKRLTFGYAAIMLVVVFLGIYVTLNLKRLNYLTHSINSVDSATIRLVERLQAQIFSQVGFVEKFLISGDPDFYQKIQEMKGRVMEDFEKFNRLSDSSENQSVFHQIGRSYQRYLSLFDEEVVAMKEEQNHPQEKFERVRGKIIDGINHQFSLIMKEARFKIDKSLQLSGLISAQVLKVSMLTAGLIIVMGLLISFFNTRSINRSIMLLQKKTREITKGKFDVISNINSPPEIRKLADDFNIMSERLKELDAMKIDFVSHVSHELRTPLTAIKEASSMLLEGTFSNAPNKQHELFKITKEECERLINAVNRILDLSRMEAKMMDYHFTESSLAPVIEKSVLKLAPIAQRKKIDLDVKSLEALPLVSIDVERIGQVLENLLGNALKFTPTGGRILIDASLVGENEKKLFIISVEDSGCGISKENMGIIFNKFERIDNGREIARGTGLGLSIAKFIIMAHGGKIWAESEPGKGSVFYFALPV